MSKLEPFEWTDFNILANSYLNENNESKQRTAISRYYYGSFCTTRDYLNENEIYLDKSSKEKMKSKKSDVHGETSKIFRKHEKFKQNNIGRDISKQLDKLRKMRNEADYDKITSDSLDKMMIKSKIRSETILKLLDELN